jgi:eukaryotic-like serine/threonine-protein kinase
MTRPDRVGGRDPGIVLGGRYRLVSRIASGGMGTVWEGQDETLQRPMAVKVLNEGLANDPRFLERFRREARHAAGLSHPNIAGVYDYGEDDGRPYIVMELVDGEDLAERLARVERLDPGEAGAIGSQVAAALAHAHAAGIVHRDIKPANVMLTHEGEVKVTDFGIAAPLQGSTGLTVTGSVMGTSRYISPEQAAGDRATPASDVYSLGVVLYESMAGTTPFVRESPVATALAHIHDQAPPLRELRPETPAELAAVVQACLAKEPEDRPTAAALAASLRSDAGAPPMTPSGEEDPATTDGGTEVLPLGTVGAQRSQPTRPLTAVPTGPSTASPQGPPVEAPTAVPRERDRRRRLLLVLGAFALLFLIVGILTAGNVSTVRTPHFVGLTQGAAVARAERAGLHPRARVVTSDARAGTVVDQRPVAGKMIPAGAPVTLSISSGPTAASPPPPPSPSPKPPKGNEKGHGPGHGHGNGQGEND